MSYTIKYLGGGKFEATLENGDIKEVGPNILGMIRYTFFEDFTLPPVGWEVTQKVLLEAYQPKVMEDIAKGKIALGQHKFGDTDWVEQIN